MPYYANLVLFLKEQNWERTVMLEVARLSFNSVKYEYYKNTQLLYRLKSSEILLRKRVTKQKHW